MSDLADFINGSTAAQVAVRKALAAASGTEYLLSVRALPADCPQCQGQFHRDLGYGGNGMLFCSEDCRQEWHERKPAELPDPVHHHDVFSRIEASTRQYR